jgi:putative ABC transport system permease protein
VVIVNESFARRYFDGRNPIGERVYENGLLSEIIGVVGDVKTYLDKPAEPTVFVPASQALYATSKLFEGWFPRSIVVETSGDPLTLGQPVREAVTAVDPLVAPGAIRSMDQVLTHSLALRSFMMFLLSLFGGLALFLAGVGIYGVIGYAVSQRTREIGVRMAMGAEPRQVLRMVLCEGLKLVLTGLFFGVAAALMLMRLLEGLVYGVSMRDPLIFIIVNLVMLFVAMLACYFPARRAARVDPLVALRYE